MSNDKEQFGEDYEDDVFGNGGGDSENEAAFQVELTPSFWAAARQKAAELDREGHLECYEDMGLNVRTFLFEGDETSVEKMTGFLRKLTAH